ncbi:serine protease inhibitor 88Ea-like isoform X2 [Aphidius gifuensis]|uniref:serine protease inhibitor 88Ea-like isoform X2 n=1 Tax=Aphidius gifuensis TaxID=684658 RepID=UPI001CDC2353|nr:serine protease inhibitor 88Ea-like isoform X2 [Aphidius gifuensis]
MNIKMLSVLLFISILSTINCQCLTSNDSPTTGDENSKALLTMAELNFALDSLDKVALIEARDNVFYSPHSIHEALVLAYFGARGETEKNLKKALKIPEELSKIDIQRSYALDKSIKQFAKSLQNSSETNYEFTTANRLYISSGKMIRECMLDLFGSQLEKVDFKSNPSEITMMINEWVSNTTKGNIKDLIPSDGIDEATDLVLVNAVYFKGLWQNKFDLADSKRDIFYGSKNSIVTYMTQKKTFNYMVAEDLGAYVIQMPYKGEDISMFVFLPPFAMARSLGDNSTSSIERDGIKKLITRMTTNEKGVKELQDILTDGMPQREVEVTFPKFTIEKELPMGTLLDALGAGDLMKANVADLRGFVDDKEGLHLGDAVHKAKIEINEEGTTAAAATALFSFRSSRPAEPAVFNANHPFVYIIYDKNSQSILFTGIYRTPVIPVDTNTS